MIRCAKDMKKVELGATDGPRVLISPLSVSGTESNDAHAVPRPLGV
jgi:hypothetical protein